MMRLIVAVRHPVGAGSIGFTRLASGSVSAIGRKQPPLLGMRAFGSVTARSAKQAAANGPDGMQLNGQLAPVVVPHDQADDARKAVFFGSQPDLLFDGGEGPRRQPTGPGSTASSAAATYSSAAGSDRPPRNRSHQGQGDTGQQRCGRS